MASPRPKCFIAMAFGNRDKDGIYEECIKPSVESVGFSPRVVNRINYNNDIDDRIFQELDDCQLCVADLTYARPSVYYEAGYARARSVPVVHTVRADHFGTKAPDNLRVHFDLQMKNIIDWKSQSDSKFLRRLKERLTLVGTPILSALAADQTIREERALFSQSSIRARMNHLEQVLGGEMICRGYSHEGPGSDSVFVRRIGHYLHMVRFHLLDRLSTSYVNTTLNPYRLPLQGNRRLTFLEVYVGMNAMN